MPMPQSMSKRMCDEITHLREERDRAVAALESIEQRARSLANDPMTPERGLWSACADQARDTLAAIRARSEQGGPREDLLLADAEARQKGKNLDGSERRETKNVV